MVNILNYSMLHPITLEKPAIARPVHPLYFSGVQHVQPLFDFDRMNGLLDVLDQKQPLAGNVRKPDKVNAFELLKQVNDTLQARHHGPMDSITFYRYLKRLHAMGEPSLFGRMRMHAFDDTIIQGRNKPRQTLSAMWSERQFQEAIRSSKTNITAHETMAEAVLKKWHVSLWNRSKYDTMDTLNAYGAFFSSD